MRGEGEEEESCNLKALKTASFTISVSSSFLYPFDSFSGEKRGNGRDFYMWGEWGKEKEKKRVYTALDDALLALYRELLRESLYRVYKGLIGLNIR